MYLKREPPMSLPKAAFDEELLLHASAARKDSAVHVSLSSDSLFKQPGDHGDPHPPVSRRAGEARASENYRIPIHCSSEELQRRAIAPLADGAPLAFRRDGAPAKHLTIVVTRRPISVGGFGLRRLSGYSGEGDRTISGLFDK